MPYDEIIIGLSHKGVKGNPAFHSHLLAEAFPDRECLSIRMDRWIPVTERLPDHTDIVIVCDADGVWFAYRNKMGVWFDPCNGCMPENITHWMPLPEPPSNS